MTALMMTFFERSSLLVWSNGACKTPKMDESSTAKRLPDKSPHGPSKMD